MTAHRLRPAVVCCWIYFLFVLIAPCVAVDLEFGAGAPEEQFYEYTSAEIHAHILGQSGGSDVKSIDGAATDDAEIAESGNFAGSGDHEAPEAHTEVAASIFTNIKRDSPEAIFALTTPGLELPATDEDYVLGHGAYGFSTKSGINVESSLHAYSAKGEDPTDTSSMVHTETIYDEETSEFLEFVDDPIIEEWTIDVLPSSGETPGTPTLVKIDTVVSGILAASETGEAFASWFVTVNEDVELIAGTANNAQLTAFGEAASYGFVVPLGDSFKLRFLWELTVSATDVATAAAEFTAASINISASILPEPSSWLILATGLMIIQRRRIRYVVR